MSTPQPWLPPRELFIGGRWQPSAGGRVMAVIDPSTTAVLADVADADVVDAVHAVDAADKAMRDWRETPPRGRSEILLGCFELITEWSERLACLISDENGKALSDARGEVAYAAEFFRWYAEEAVRIDGELDDSPASGQSDPGSLRADRGRRAGHAVEFPRRHGDPQDRPRTRRGMRGGAQARANTPLTALAIAELMAEAGVPDGVVNVITDVAQRGGGRRHAPRPARAQALVHRVDAGRPDPARARPATK